uniref:Uncharacterized protein n=1 Tax=Branchiostoma floridae TaxID=7739 RepID=C3Z185_BRAFL|eukprot:XP_002597772.1 hypothetical protein BRAFLDRAFT_77325 [Branchiostoma floridae]
MEPAGRTSGTHARPSSFMELLNDGSVGPSDIPMAQWSPYQHQAQPLFQYTPKPVSASVGSGLQAVYGYSEGHQPLGSATSPLETIQQPSNSPATIQQSSNHPTVQQPSNSPATTTTPPPSPKQPDRGPHVRRERS